MNEHFWKEDILPDTQRDISKLTPLRLRLELD